MSKSLPPVSTATRAGFTAPDAPLATPRRKKGRPGEEVAPREPLLAEEGVLVAEAGTGAGGAEAAGTAGASAGGTGAATAGTAGATAAGSSGLLAGLMSSAWTWIGLGAAGAAAAGGGGGGGGSAPAGETQVLPEANDATGTGTEDDDTFEGQLAATDGNGDALTFAAVGALPDGVVLNADGSFLVTPLAADQALDDGESRTVSFDYVVNDGRADSAPATVNITITGINDAPVSGGNASAAGSEDDATITGNVPAASDVDGEVLTYSLVSPTPPGLTFKADGTFSYAPQTEDAALDAGEARSFTFSYKASDGTADSATATVTITVTGANDAPVSGGEATASGSEDDAAISGNVPAASDVDGEALTYELTAAAPAGLTFSSDGTFSYVPQATDNALDSGETRTISFQYVANDGTTTSAPATVTITVNGANDAPVSGGAAAVSGSEDDAGIGGNVPAASDVDGETLTYTLTDTAPPGLTFNPDGSFSYVPPTALQGLDSGQSATVSFQYVASDGTANSTPATVAIIIMGANDAPVASNGSAAGSEDAASVTGSVSAADVDIEALTYSIVGATPAGLTFNSNGTFSYLPTADADLDSGETRDITFSYMANDGTADSNTATVTITVSGANDAPVSGGNTSVSGSEDAASITGTVSATDVDGEALTYALTATAPAGLTFNSNGSFSYVPQAADQALAAGGTRTVTFDYVASDGTANSAPATATITVNGANDAPSINVTAVTTPVKDGSEFRVNTTTADTQLNPAVAALADGGFVATWMSYGQDGSVYGIYGQRYAANGTAVGSEFRVNTFTSNEQEQPAVAGLVDGGFVVTWMSMGQDLSDYGIYAQRYAADGTAAGSEFIVNTTELGAQTYPAVAALANGGFVVAWQTSDSSGNGIAVRRFSADGTAQGSGSLVNTFTTDEQQLADIAGLQNGGFVVTWQSNLEDGSGYGIYGQRFTQFGVKAGTAFQINTTMLQSQINSDVTVLDGGGFVVTWQSNAQDGSGYGIYGQRYAADGTAQGSEFRINTTTSGAQVNSAVTALHDGGFVVAWQSGDGSTNGIYAQRYAANGTAVGTEFRINTFTTNEQQLPSLAVLANGDLLATWTSYTQDGSNWGIYAQRFAIALDANTGTVTEKHAITTVSGQLPVSDVDSGDTHTWSITNTSTYGSMSIAVDGTWTFTLDNTSAATRALAAGRHVTETFTATATDSQGASTTHTVSVVINGANDAPVALNATASGSENTTNIFGSVSSTDVDGTSRSYSLTDPAPAGLSFGSAGGFIYTPQAADQALDSGETRQVVFQYVVSDGIATSAPATATITITGANDAPVANALSLSGSEDAASITGTVSAADVDVETLTYTLTTAAPAGLTFNSDGTFSYVPQAADAALDSGESRQVTFSYKANDGTVDSSTATVTLTITGANDAPVSGGAASASGSEDAASITGSVPAASDVDGETLTYALTAAAPAGLTFNSNGTFSYVPQAADFALDTGESRTVTFDYVANDGTTNSASATVALTINGANDAPVASAGSASGSEDDASISGSVSASDVDVETLTYSISGVTPASLTFNSDGTFSYVPQAADNALAVGESRNVTFNYVANDGAASSAPATVTITVNGANDTPVISAPSSQSGEPQARGGEVVVDTNSAIDMGFFMAMDINDEPAIAALADGGFVSIWKVTTASTYDVRGQRYDAAGEPVGDQFQVNTSAASAQLGINVVSNGEGGFVAVWANLEAGGTAGVIGQRFDADGNKVGSEFQVNTTTVDQQLWSDMDKLADGGFVVTWSSDGQDGDSHGIFAQRFAEDGSRVGSEFQVNTFTAGAQLHSNAAGLADGGFVVTWASYGQDNGSDGIYGQRYAADGAAVGDEFRVNTEMSGWKERPVITALADGGFVMAWLSYGQDGNSYGVYAQRFAADGVAVGSEFRINTTTANAQIISDLIATDDGGFIALWTSMGQDEGWNGVYLRRYGADGAAIGGEVQVNISVGDPQAPAGAVLADGSLVVNWVSWQSGSPGSPVVMRHFDLGAPAENPAVAEDGALVATGTLEATDPDAGDTLTWSITDDSAYGSMSITADGTWTFTLDNDVAATNALAEGETVEQTFTATVTDSHGASDTRALTITITGTNDAPVIVASPVTTPVPEGAEFRVNTTTALDQTEPAVAALADSGFVVTWYSQGQDGSGYGVYGQRYAADGTAVGTEFLINSETFDQQFVPSVAALADGGFVVTWQSSAQDGSGFGVYGQRFAADGTAAGAEFRISTTTENNQLTPVVTALADGGFVVAWASLQDLSSYDVLGQRFAADGTAVGSEFLINTGLADFQYMPVVSALAGGGFVVAWESRLQSTPESNIRAQRFASDGTAVGTEFLVNTETLDLQSGPAVAALADGGFVVTWSSTGQDGSANGIYGQRYAADGTAAGAEFRINTTTFGEQAAPAVSALADGGFVVTWQSWAQEEGVWSDGIYGQRYAADGTAAGEEFRINTTTAWYQQAPAATTLADGSLLVAWQSNVLNGQGFEIHAQRFGIGGLTPLTGSVGEDGPTLVTGRLAVSDVDEADTHTWSITDDSDYGSMNIAADGTWTFTLDNDAAATQALDAGQIVTETFTVTVSDSHGATAARNVQVVITGTNDVPAATALSLVALRDGGAVAVALAGSDADDETLSFSIATGPAHGTLQLIDGQYFYSPDSGYTGADSFTYTASDGRATSAPETVTIAVQATPINGTEGNDVLYGTAQPETIHGLGGNDFLIGHGADDWLYGDDGDDSLQGVGGNDILWGGAGINSLSGDYGDDTLINGDDGGSLNGGVGNDLLLGGAGHEHLSGGDGDDVLAGGGGGGVMMGDEGNDTYRYARGDDMVFIDNVYAPFIEEGEDAGFDVLEFGADISLDDIVLTRYGDALRLDLGTYDEIFINNYFAPEAMWHIDEIRFTDGSGLVLTLADVLLLAEGEGGVTYGSQNAETFFGTPGADTFDARAGDDLLLGRDSDDYLFGGRDDDQVFGEGGDDVLQGDEGEDEVIGGAGNDHLIGGSGDDYLVGGDGDDRYHFARGDGQDSLYNENPSGAAGVDEIVFYTDITPDDVSFMRTGYDLYVRLDGGADEIYVPRYFDSWDSSHDIAPIDFIRFNDGSGTLLTPDDVAALAFSYMKGTEGDDILTGTMVGDTVEGLGGNDSLHGEAGDDVLRGGSGEDFIAASSGDDLIEGGTGNDVMGGGDGSDTFVFNAGDGNDRVYSLDGFAEFAGFGLDVIELGSTITFAHLGFSRAGADTNDLLITLVATGDSVLVGGYFSADARYEIDEIRFNDGSGLVLTRADVLPLTVPRGPTITGTDGDDFMLQGTALGERIEGLEGNDILTGFDGDDELVGGSGDDALYGYEGNDTLIGGAGNDGMAGGLGSDLYQFGRGDGQDFIYNGQLEASDVDVLEFAADIVVDDLVFERVDADLLIRIDGSTDQVLLKDYYTGTDYELDEIRFTDGSGTVLTPADILALLSGDSVGTAGDDVLYGTADANTLDGLAGNDSLVGNAGNDTLIGGEGDDSLFSDAGDDTFVIRRGDGSDVIYSHTLTAVENPFSGSYQHVPVGPVDLGGTDVVEFGADIALADVTFTRLNTRDLAVTLDGETGQLLIPDFFAEGPGFVVDAFRFTDGSGLVLTQAEVEASSGWLVGTSGRDYQFSLGGDAGDNHILGLGDIDELYGADGADLIEGGAGNDALYGEAGDDTLLDGDDSNVLYGGDGNDLLMVQSRGRLYDGSALDGGNGNDTLIVTAGHNSLYGRAGDDVLQGGSGNDRLIGGAGNDTYFFGPNGGIDHLHNVDWDETGVDSGYDVIEIDASLGIEDVTLTAFGDDLYLMAHDTLSVLIVYGYYGSDTAYHIDEIRFADGSGVPVPHGATTGDDILTGFDWGNDSLDGLAGNDALRGLEGADTLTGGTGDDFLDGGHGNDTYVFNLGDGQDYIHNFSWIYPPFTQLQATLTGALYDGDEITDPVFPFAPTVDSFALTGLNDGSLYHVYFTSADFDTTLKVVDQDGNVVAQNDDTDADTEAGLVADLYFTARDGMSYSVWVGGYNLLEGGDYEVLVEATAGFETDTIEFGTGILPEDLAFTRYGDKLLIEVGTGGDRIVVQDRFLYTTRTEIDAIRFADAAVELNTDDIAKLTVDGIGTLLAGEAWGNKGDNVLQGDAGANLVQGLRGDDTLSGDEGDDTLLGGTGDDALYGGWGDDILEGGSGNDILEGFGGADTFRFNRGDGCDLIYSSDWDENGVNGHDALELGPDIAYDDVNFMRGGSAGEHLVLAIPGYMSRDILVVADYFRGDDLTGLEEIRFTDGSGIVLTAAQVAVLAQTAAQSGTLWGTPVDDLIYGSGGAYQVDALEGNDEVYGESGSDTLNGGPGNDMLDGGAGDDQLIGGEGDDLLAGGSGHDNYHWDYNYGDGADVIVETLGHDHDELVIWDVPLDVDHEYSMDGDDLVIQIGPGLDDSITIRDFFRDEGLAGNTAVEEITFIYNNGHYGEIVESVTSQELYNQFLP